MKVFVTGATGAIGGQLVPMLLEHGHEVTALTRSPNKAVALEGLGADVTHFIPERLRDGYGLQPTAIDRLHAEGVAVVVSVDCGIRGADAANRDARKEAWARWKKVLGELKPSK